MIKKNIYIPIHQYNSIGGPSTFMNNLYNYLSEDTNCKLNDKNANLALFASTYNIEYLENLKRRGGKIIQRLDGIHYEEKHGVFYDEKNRAVEHIYKNLSDFYIFQSEYCKKQCFEMFGEVPQNKYKLIINGVNKDIFYPDKSKKINSDEPIKIITTGNFRNIDMVEPVVKAIDELINEYNIELIFLGPFTNPDLQHFLNRKYIKHHISESQTEIAYFIRESHIFIYSHLNPPCPNSVVEAVSCGIPLTGFDSGAMKELCYFAEELFADAGNKVFQEYKDFDYKKLKEKIVFLIKNYDKYKKIALNYSYLYDIKECGKNYKEVIIKQLQKINVISLSFAKFANIKNKVMNKIYEKILIILHYKIYEKNLIQLFINRLCLLKPYQVREFIVKLIVTYIKKLSPKESLTLLFELDKELYLQQGYEAIKYNGGIHPKHRLMQYHDFFIDNITENDTVLDIGCGKGELAGDMAKKAKQVSGIEISKTSYEFAISNYKADNLTFINADALQYDFNNRVSTITLSNVLEHIENRPEFLKNLKSKYNPDKILIRVPLFDRDWRVPLKKEIGVDYRLDETHYTEYLLPQFKQEINDAGVEIIEYSINWGEIWAVCK